VLSCCVNGAILLFLWAQNYSVRDVKLNKFLRILRMFSVFSFPVHAALINPSFLLKSKISLVALLLDTRLSFFKLHDLVAYFQFALETVRFFAYPHILYIILS
jgi:hypothetical protein